MVPKYCCWQTCIKQETVGFWVWKERIRCSSWSKHLSLARPLMKIPNAVNLWNKFLTSFELASMLTRKQKSFSLLFVGLFTSFPVYLFIFLTKYMHLKSSRVPNRYNSVSTILSVLWYLICMNKTKWNSSIMFEFECDCFFWSFLITQNWRTWLIQSNSPTKKHIFVIVKMIDSKNKASDACLVFS